MAYSKNRRLAEIVSDTSGNLSVEGLVVPTQSSSDNDTSAASTAFVHAHIDAVLDSAPGTLNTLNEIAAALNDDANFNTTVTNAIAAKAPLASPAFNSGTANVVASFTSTDGTGAIQLADNAGNVELAAVGNDFHIQNAGSAAKMVVLNSGNVGIGTTSPLEKLTVVGAASTGVNGLVKFQSNTTHTYSGTGFIGTGRSLDLIPNSNDNADSSGIRFSNPGGSRETFLGVVQSGGQGDLVVQGYNGSAYVENFRITSAGNVGIKTAAPTHQLHIKGPSSGYAAMRIESTSTSHGSIINMGDSDDDYGQIVQFASSAGEGGRMRFVAGGTETMNLRGGKVGIGTATPGSNHAKANNLVVGSGSAGGMAIFNGTGEGWYAFSRANANNTDSYDGGISYDGSRNLKFHTNAGAARMTIKGTGKVGINTTDPKQLLQVKETSTANQVHYPVSIGGSTHVAGYAVGIGLDPEGYGDRNKVAIVVEGRNNGYSRGLMHFLMDKTDDSSSATIADSKMVIHEDGLVGIGTTQPGRPLDISHSAGSHTPVLRLSGMSTSAYSGGLEWYSGYGPKVTAEMHSTASGSQGGEWWLNVRNQNSNAQSRVMSVNNIGRLRLSGLSEACSGAFNVMGEVGNSYDAIQFYHNSMTLVGRIRTAGSSTSYNTSSDYRLKENVDYTWDATTRLKQLKPARFNFIADADTIVDGFLAHEVSSVVPEAITGTKDAVDGEGNPDYQGIDQSKLVPLLVKTIQELEARITTLEG